MAFGAALMILTPLLILRCKDSFEKLFFNTRMTEKDNFFCTTGFIVALFILSLVIPDIGDVIQVNGATSNMIIGFILPSMFYLKIHEAEHGRDTWTFKKILAYSVNIVVVCLSIASLSLYTQQKMN